MRKTAFFLISVFLLSCFFGIPSSAAKAELNLNAKSAILMEANSGTVLYEQNADEPLPPASVTKVMTLLLVMEAVDDGRLSLSDMVCTSAHAASMGGSQIFLKEGEEMTVEDMIKSVVIASANDAAVALAEKIAGSESSFVSAMNEKAAALGMEQTHFENTNGLDDTAVNHVTSARDIALMSRELIVKHPKILEYSSIWMDTVRNGAFTLSNTNRLIRFYSGATGLKTGSTSKALFCISATAKRNDLSLIAVIMGSPTRDIRNEAAKNLLDYGFAGYENYHGEEMALEDAVVLGGTADHCRLQFEPLNTVLEKGAGKRVETEIQMPGTLSAPISRGQVVGRVIYRLDGEELGVQPIRADEDVPKIAFSELLCRILSRMAMK